MTEITLASRSPQRRAILEQIGIPFRVVEPGVEELSEGDPRELVRENARRKAAAVEGELVLGVDTEVVSEGRALIPSRPGSIRAFGSWTRPSWGGTWTAANGRSGRGPTPSRGAERRSWSASRATT